VSKVLEVGSTLDREAIDGLIRQMSDLGEGDRAIVDSRHIRFANPYGMVGLLAVGRHLAERGEKPVLRLPALPDVGSYLARMRFPEEAERLYDLEGSVEKPRGTGLSNVLLEITPIGSHEDVHLVVDRVHERAGVILKEKLGYPPASSSHFAMMLSEVCQNIIEHAEAAGWVGIQSYNWARVLGRQVVMIAVMDLGVGFRGSLEKEHAARHEGSWSDATALEAAFLHGTTRFRDPGRGQGLKQIRSRVQKWHGKASIRSGTARITEVPDWEDAEPVETGLAPFPGSQIEIILPATEPNRR
jgi:hypothetical protein